MGNPAIMAELALSIRNDHVSALVACNTFTNVTTPIKPIPRRIEGGATVTTRLPSEQDELWLNYQLEGDDTQWIIIWWNHGGVKAEVRGKSAKSLSQTARLTLTETSRFPPKSKALAEDSRYALALGLGLTPTEGAVFFIENKTGMSLPSLHPERKLRARLPQVLAAHKVYSCAAEYMADPDHHHVNYVGAKGEFVLVFWGRDGVKADHVLPGAKATPPEPPFATLLDVAPRDTELKYGGTITISHKAMKGSTDIPGELPADVLAHDGAAAKLISSKAKHCGIEDSIKAFKDLLSDCPDLWVGGQFTLHHMTEVMCAKIPLKDAPNAYKLWTEFSDSVTAGQFGDIERSVVTLGSSEGGTGLTGTYQCALYGVTHDKCGPIATAGATAITAQGGLRGKGRKGWKKEELTLGKPDGTGQASDAPYYQLIRYDDGVLSDAVDTMKVWLDEGRPIVAGVCSGRTCETFPWPDHYVLIVGYDGDMFAYWDPDQSQSNREKIGPCFGTLTYILPGVTSPAHRVAGHARLSTARVDAEMACFGEGSSDDGMFTVVPPLSSTTYVTIRGVLRGARADVNHRYQVMTIKVVA